MVWVSHVVGPTSMAKTAQLLDRATPGFKDSIRGRHRWIDQYFYSYLIPACHQCNGSSAWWVVRVRSVSVWRVVRLGHGRGREPWKAIRP